MFIEENFSNFRKELRKKVLIIAGTHGDEPLGEEVVSRLKELGCKDRFDWLIANPRAREKNEVFCDSNLNRAYPGDENSQKYEERRAAELYSFVKKNYPWQGGYKIIDVHEAKDTEYNENSDSIIIARNKIPKTAMVDKIDLGKILLWANPRGPMSEVIPNLAEVEFASKGRNRKAMISEAAEVLRKFIDSADGKNIEMVNKIKKIYKVGKPVEPSELGRFGLTLEKLRKKKNMDRIITPEKKEVTLILPNQYLGRQYKNSTKIAFFEGKEVPNGKSGAKPR